jgi:hypothetical protein
VFRPSSQAVQLRRGGLQGQRVLSHRQPRLGQEFREREPREIHKLGIGGLIGFGFFIRFRCQCREVGNFDAGDQRIEHLQLTDKARSATHGRCARGWGCASPGQTAQDLTRLKSHRSMATAA